MKCLRSKKEKKALLFSSGGGLALGTPWSLASPDAVGADTPETTK